MGGINLGKAIFDPLGVTGIFDDRPGKPQSQPAAPPSQLALDAAWAGMNPEKGFVGGMTGPDTGLVLPDVGADFGHENDNKPRQAPFAAQWSYTPGKGPQWLEPVDKGTSQVRTGDVHKNVDNGWSTQFSTGPVKGNRF